MMTVPIEKMKKYVGMAKRVPASRMPRRLASVISAMTPIPIGTRIVVKVRDGGGDGGDTGGDADRDSEDVVDEEGSTGKQAGAPAEVFVRHDVGATPARVGLDRLPV